MTQEALKLALKWAENHGGVVFDGGGMIAVDSMTKWQNALKEALAQTQEPVAWPCLIDSADFSKNTITLVMQCDDYKVSAGTHWLSTTPPQRTWVGLTDEEICEIEEEELPWREFLIAFAKAVEAKLKELNT